MIFFADGAASRESIPQGLKPLFVDGLGGPSLKAWLAQKQFALLGECPCWRIRTWGTLIFLRGLFFFEDEVGSGGAGGDFDPVGNSGRDVNDVSGVEDDLFSAFDAGAEGFAGAAGAGVGALSLHGAAGDEGDGAFVDDDLVGEELMTLGVSGVKADYQEGVVVAVVFESPYCEAGGARLGGFDQLGFALLEVGGGVDGGLGGLGDERGGEESEGQEDAR